MDDHTLLLLHAENGLDSSNYHRDVQVRWSQEYSQNGKFDKCFKFSLKPINSILFNNIIPENGDFTIDWWDIIEKTNQNKSYMMSFGAQFIQTDIAGNTIKFAGVDLGSPSPIWTHRAIVKNGAEFITFENGKIIARVPSVPISPATYDCINGWYFDNFGGGVANSGADWKVDEFRISDVARWTDDFTPPDHPYGEEANLGPSIIDGVAHKIQKGKILINGVVHEVPYGKPLKDGAVLKIG